MWRKTSETTAVP